MGIDEEEIAFPFDIECNEVLTEWEMEMEQERLEALAANLFTASLSIPSQSAATNEAAKKFREGTF